MKTDVPLKRIIQLRAADLLPLLGAPDAEVLGVETLELPASATSLDTVLRLRQPGGQEYLHLIEWQGWRDPKLLWRTLGYLAWLGQNRDERPILATIVYLAPSDDVGETLDQQVANRNGWQVTLPCVRLWEEDAAAALRTGSPGLATLSPLMRGATDQLVAQAARIIIDTVAQPTQGELLAALGTFAEPIFSLARFFQLVTKERLMTSTFIRTLFHEEFDELEQELQRSLRQAVEDVLVARFPQAPVTTIRDIRSITDRQRLQGLVGAIAQAADVETAVRLLREATVATG